jgi:hypothetical protein
VRTAGLASTELLVRGAAAFWKELVAEGRKVLMALMHTSSTKEIIIAYSTAVVPS